MAIYIEKYIHYQICENQNYLEYCLLTKIGEDRYRSIIQPVYCKDYFQDIFKSMYLKKDIDEPIYDVIYKYNSDEDVFKDTHFHMLLCSKLKNHNYSIGKINVLTYVFNTLEEAMNFKEKSSFKSTSWSDKIVDIPYESKVSEKLPTNSNAFNNTLCHFSIEWLASPWLCSFLFGLLRNVFLFVDTDVVENLKAYDKVAQLLMLYDNIRLESSLIYLEVYKRIIKYGHIEIPNYNWNWDSNTKIDTTWHNNSGVSSNYVIIVGSYKNINKNKQEDEVEECIDRV